MATVKVTREMAEAAMREVDWRSQNALTDEDIARQISDNPDAAPDMSTDRFATAAVVQRVRRATGLSQAEFGLRYQIPVRTLQHWEQGRREPDQTVLAYLRVIAAEPEAVARALSKAA